MRKVIILLSLILSFCIYQPLIAQYNSIDSINQVIDSIEIEIRHNSESLRKIPVSKFFNLAFNKLNDDFDSSIDAICNIDPSNSPEANLSLIAKNLSNNSEMEDLASLLNLSSKQKKYKGHEIESYYKTISNDLLVSNHHKILNYYLNHGNNLNTLEGGKALSNHLKQILKEVEHEMRTREIYPKNVQNKSLLKNRFNIISQLNELTLTETNLLIDKIPDLIPVQEEILQLHQKLNFIEEELGIKKSKKVSDILHLSTIEKRLTALDFGYKKIQESNLASWLYDTEGKIHEKIVENTLKETKKHYYEKKRIIPMKHGISFRGPPRIPPSFEPNNTPPKPTTSPPSDSKYNAETLSDIFPNDELDNWLNKQKNISEKRLRKKFDLFLAKFPSTSRTYDLNIGNIFNDKIELNPLFFQDEKRLYDNPLEYFSTKYFHQFPKNPQEGILAKNEFDRLAKQYYPNKPNLDPSQFIKESDRLNIKTQWQKSLKNWDEYKTSKGIYSEIWVDIVLKENIKGLDFLASPNLTIPKSELKIRPPPSIKETIKQLNLSKRSFETVETIFGMDTKNSLQLKYKEINKVIKLNKIGDSYKNLVQYQNSSPWIKSLVSLPKKTIEEYDLGEFIDKYKIRENQLSNTFHNMPEDEITDLLPKEMIKQIKIAKKSLPRPKQHLNKGPRGLAEQIPDQGKSLSVKTPGGIWLTPEYMPLKPSSTEDLTSWYYLEYPNNSCFSDDFEWEVEAGSKVCFENYYDKPQVETWLNQVKIIK